MVARAFLGALVECFRSSALESLSLAHQSEIEEAGRRGSSYLSKPKVLATTGSCQLPPGQGDISTTRSTEPPRSHLTWRQYREDSVLSSMHVERQTNKPHVFSNLLLFLGYLALFKSRLGAIRDFITLCLSLLHVSSS